MEFSNLWVSAILRLGSSFRFPDSEVKGFVFCFIGIAVRINMSFAGFKVAVSGFIFLLECRFL